MEDRHHCMANYMAFQDNTLEISGKASSPLPVVFGGAYAILPDADQMQMMPTWMVHKVAAEAQHQ